VGIVRFLEGVGGSGERGWTVTLATATATVPAQTTPLPVETRTSLLLVILRCFRGVRGFSPIAFALLTVKLTCMWAGANYASPNAIFTGATNNTITTHSSHSRSGE
jgi:hypothetical protein